MDSRHVISSRVLLSGTGSIGAPIRTLWICVLALLPALFPGCRRASTPLIDTLHESRVPLIEEEPSREFEALKDQVAAPAPSDGALRARKIRLPSDVRNGYIVPVGGGFGRRFLGEGTLVFRCRVRRAIDDGRLKLTLSIPEAGILKEFEPPGDRWMKIDCPITAATRAEFHLEIRISPLEGHPVAPVFLANPEFLRPGIEDDRPNILFISVDTLRRDHLSYFGYQRPSCPKLSRWAHENAAGFDQAITAASWTLPAHVSMLTGLDAARHGINHDVGGSSRKTGAYGVFELDFLAEKLRRAGWTTAAFTGGAYVHEKFGFAQGFDRFLSWPDRAHDAEELPRHCRLCTEFFSSHRTSPAFVFLHTYAVHDPYRAWPEAWKHLFPTDPPGARIALHSPKNDPKKAFKQVNELLFRPRNGKQRPLLSDELELAEKMYDTGIRFTDEMLGQLFQHLREEDLDRNLVIIVTSDHGESLGEGGRFGHVDLSDEVLRVPLFFSFPDRLGAGRLIREQIRSVDIVPTLLEYLGLLSSKGQFDGVSLLPLLRGETWKDPGRAWSFSEAANRGISLRLPSGKKLLFDTTAWQGSGPQLEFFDSRADPREEHPIISKIPPQLIERVEEYLDARASGLRLVLSNHSGQRFSGILEGGMIRPVGTKILNLTDARLTFLEMGKAAFALEDGEEIRLSFEKVFGNRLEIHTEDTGRIPGMKDVFDLDRLTGETGISFDGRHWVESRNGEIEIRIGWRGGNRELDTSSNIEDEELLRQLQALGYITN